MQLSPGKAPLHNLHCCHVAMSERLFPQSALIYYYVYVFCLLSAQSGAEPNTLLSAWGQQHRASSSGNGSPHGSKTMGTHTSHQSLSLPISC